MWQITFYPHVNQSFRRKQPNSHIKRTTRTRFAKVLYFWFWGFQSIFLSTAILKSPLYHIVWWNYPLTKGKTIFMRVFHFRHPFMTNPTIFWTLLCSNEYEPVQHFVIFLSGKKKKYRLLAHILIFVVNIRPARTFWNSTQPFHTWLITEFIT